MTLFSKSFTHFSIPYLGRNGAGTTMPIANVSRSRNEHGNITCPSVTSLIQFDFMLKMKHSQDYLNQGQYSFRWEV